ncbi:class I SAM-dependent methyltransferase [Myxosarcina sp. GI1(2024)]
MKNIDNKEPWYSMYREIADNYSRQQRESWYSSVADAYHRTRPRYHQTVCDLVKQLTNLTSSSTVLELGCGPGTATVSLAKLGWSLVCLEPSYEACQLAKQNCREYPQVEIINTSFEAWELDGQKFDAVLAATSFHWLDPQVKYQKTAAALKDNGFLILLWNTPPQIELGLYKSLQKIYQTYAPKIEYQSIATHSSNLNQIVRAVDNSGYYDVWQSEELVCEVTYSLDEYLTLLSTLSPYIMLDTHARKSLFENIREILQKECGATLQLSHLMSWQIARKIKLDRHRSLR